MVKTLIVLAFAAGYLPLAAAQVQRDPTQPPASYLVLPGGTSPADEEAAPDVRVLQSILRPHGAKPRAVINGQSLGVGGKIDEWVVVRIGEGEVVLKGPGGMEKLVMTPGVEKQPARPVIVRRQR
jgi:hypothetical protein